MRKGEKEEEKVGAPRALKNESLNEKKKKEPTHFF